MNSLICYTIQQKIHETQKICILVNKTTSLFTSITDSKISRGCAKILEVPEGRGVGILGADFGKSRGEGGSYGKSLPWGGGGGMDIFWNHTILVNSMVL